MKIVLKPLAAVLIFLASQAGIGAIAGLIFKPIPPQALAVSICISGLITAIALYKMRMLEISSLDPGYLNRNYAHLGVIAALLGIFVADLVTGMFPLPDYVNEEFCRMAKSKWGVLALAGLGPLVEELVFREGIIGYLIHHNIHRWVAIIVSTVLFAAVHLNPAQIPTALVAGILLGLVYVKSHSALLTTIIHCANNFVSVMEMRHFDTMTAGFNFSQILGQRLTTIYMLVCTLLCYLFMREFLRKYHRPSKRHSIYHRHHSHRR